MTRKEPRNPARRKLIGAVALVGLALTLPHGNAFAQQETTEATNKQIIERAFADWAAGTGGPYTILAEDLVWTITGNSAASKTYNSREAFLGEVIRPFNARVGTGLKPTIHNIYAEGDTVIVHFDATGTANDGQPYVNTYAWFLDLRDGKIVRSTAFYDSVAFNDLWTRVKPTP